MQNINWNEAPEWATRVGEYLPNTGGLYWLSSNKYAKFENPLILSVFQESLCKKSDFKLIEERPEDSVQKKPQVKADWSKAPEWATSFGWLNTGPHLFYWLSETQYQYRYPAGGDTPRLYGSNKGRMGFSDSKKDFMVTEVRPPNIPKVGEIWRIKHGSLFHLVKVEILCMFTNPLGETQFWVKGEDLNPYSVHIGGLLPLQTEERLAEAFEKILVESGIKSDTDEMKKVLNLLINVQINYLNGEK